MKTFGSVLTAMVTPLNDDFSVNYDQAAKLAVRLVESGGSDGLVVAGSTGESATLSKDEKLKLFSTVLDAVGDKATVIANTGTNNTYESIEFTKQASKLGVHGAMMVGPYYNKPPQEGFYQHFKAIAESSDLPFIIYNVPGRTGTNILPETLARLAEIPNIKAVKESSGNLDQISEICRVTPDDFWVYSGDDGITLPVLAVGGVGIVSVAANVAAVGVKMQAMIKAYQAGEVKKAAKLNAELLPFFKVIFITTNPIPIKEAVTLAGIDSGKIRLPLIPATSEQSATIKKVMQELGVL